MQQVMWNIFDLAVNLFQSVLFVEFIFKIADYKTQRIPKVVPFSIASVVLFSLVTYFNSLVIFEGLAAFIYSLVLFVLCVLCFNISLLKKIILSIIPTICMVIANVIGTNFTSFLFHCSLVDLLSKNDFYRIFVVVIVNIFLVLFLYAAKRLFVKNNVAFTRLEWMLVGIVLTVSIIVFACLYVIVFLTSSDTIKLYVAFAALAIIAIDFSVYFLLIQLAKKYNLSFENALLKQHLDFNSEANMLVKQQYDQMQKIRHDFRNTLSIIRELNRNRQNDCVETYISDYLHQTNRTFLYVSTDNEYINAIVNLKLSKAREAGIVVTVDIMSDIVFSNMIDLCNIIGNLFDNAITACEECPDDKSIHFSIFQDINKTVIFIKNTIKDSVLATNPYLTTNKNNKELHGYGTKIIKQTVDVYHGFVDYFEEDGFFCCNIIMYE